MKSHPIRCAWLRVVALAAMFCAPALLANTATPYFEAIRTDPAPAAGQDYFLRHCIVFEKGEHKTTNYWRGALVPINTKVTLVSMEKGAMILRLESTKETVRVENVRDYSRCEISEIAARMLSPKPISLEGMDPGLAKAIKSGTMKRGMTKEQVIMARGYPPAHQTGTLEQDTWKYWPSRFVVQTIVFADGILSAGRGVE